MFDIYTGEQVPEGYKSAAFRLTFQSMERTLKEKEINNDRPHPGQLGPGAESQAQIKPIN